MDILGNPPTDWQKQLNRVVSDVEDAIISVWPRCRRRLTESDLDHENRISHRLVKYVREEKGLRDLPFQVHSEFELLDEDKNGDIVITGRVDIAVLFTNSEEIYFAIEAKRLYVPQETSYPKANLAPYIRDGLACFSSGQYAKQMPRGAMLGYVLARTVDYAGEMLSKAITKKADELGYISATPITFANGKAKTVHKRIDNSKITIHHLLLDANEADSA